MRAFTNVLTFTITILAAVAIGFGVPLAWIWIGSQLQGDNGATGVNFSVAMAILFGIIFTYVLLLYLAGVVMSLFSGGEASTAHGPRSPWMRGMTDARPHHRNEPLGGVERVFLITTVIVTCAFFIWFAFIAGSPLPNQ